MNIAPASALLALGPISAAEAGTASGSCTAGSEVCNVTNSNVQSSTLTLRATSASSGELIGWNIRTNDLNGTNLCTGSHFAYNTTKTCNIGSYRGRVVFVTNKTYQPAVTISVGDGVGD